MDCARARDKSLFPPVPYGSLDFMEGHGVEGLLVELVASYECHDYYGDTRRWEAFLVLGENP